jgi:hypothetical protein
MGFHQKGKSQSGSLAKAYLVKQGRAGRHRIRAPSDMQWVGAEAQHGSPCSWCICAFQAVEIPASILTCV